MVDYAEMARRIDLNALLYAEWRTLDRIDAARTKQDGEAQ